MFPRSICVQPYTHNSNSIVLKSILPKKLEKVNCLHYPYDWATRNQSAKYSWEGGSGFVGNGFDYLKRHITVWKNMKTSRKLREFTERNTRETQK